MSIFCRVFLSLIIEKRHKGTLLCCTNFLLSKNFMDQRGGGRKEGLSTISVKNFCLTLPKTFAGEPFIESLISGGEISSARERYVTIFHGSFFVSRYRKSSRGNRSLFHKTSGIEKLHG